MLSFVDLADHPDFAVSAVDCRDDHRGWSEERPREDVRVVLVREGGFRRRVRGVATDLDSTVGYLGLPGDEEHFAHPHGGDVCTSISLTPALWHAVAGDSPRLDRSALYVDGGLDLAHRRLLAAVRAADTDYAAAEGLAGLMAEVVQRVVVTTAPDGAGAVAGDRALVASARAAFGEGHPATAGLAPLAALLGVSPYRLSRAFSRELGVSLTRYRNRVRVTRALDRLEAGEPSLAVLAADLGFADQAHLCQTMREHLGYTPTAVRRLLS